MFLTRQFSLAVVGSVCLTLPAWGQKTTLWAEDFEDNTAGQTFPDIFWYAFDGPTGESVRTAQGVVADGVGGGNAARLGIDGTAASIENFGSGFWFAGAGIVYAASELDAFEDDFGTSNFDEIFVTADAKGSGFTDFGGGGRYKLIYTQKNAAGSGNTNTFRAEWSGAFSAEDTFAAIGGSLSEATITIGDASTFNPAAPEFQLQFDYQGSGNTWGFDSDNLLTWDNIEIFSQLAVGGLPGDYNASGQVEQGDLDLVLLNWGQDGTTPPGGWTNDLPVGLIDQAELDGVLLNWGDTAEPGSSAVPEPALAGLVGVLGLAVLRRR